MPFDCILDLIRVFINLEIDWILTFLGSLLAHIFIFIFKMKKIIIKFISAGWPII